MRTERTVTKHLFTGLFLLALALAMPARAAEPPVDRALAGQTVTTEVPGGQQTREYASNGRLIYETIEKTKRVDGRQVVEAIEREWHDNGAPIRDQTFVAGREMKAAIWYMNGKLKETRIDQSLRDPDGPAGTYVERYSDLGILQSSGVYQGPYRPVGVHRSYDETGTLVRETTYSATGVKLSEKNYSPTGTPSTTRYLPDGSRKLD